MKKTTNSKSNGSAKSGKSTAGSKSQNGKSTTNGKMHRGEEGGALHEFFLHGLKDMYWAEKHLVKALPKMAKAASSDELKQAIETHLEQTREHVAKLEEVFQVLDETPQAKKCDGMAGLTMEGDKTIEETEAGTMTRDAALIVAAQKVEHYEIASYGSLAQLARTMGHDQAADLLGEILDEEKDTDELLTGLAESMVNVEAVQEG